MQNKTKDTDPLKKAREYAFLLLKFRLRSEKELSQRLKDKNFPLEVIKKTIDFLKDKGFINDESFAENWLQARLRRPFGLRRIKQELELKGISEEIISRQIASVKNNYCEEEIVLEIARLRLAKLKGLPPQKAKRRVYDYLLRRGFSPRTVFETMRKL